MAAPLGGGAAVEFEIRNFHGFVFKRPLLPDAPDPEAPSAATGPGPSPEAARRKRQRRALLRLRERYRRELSEWEALERGSHAQPRAPPLPSPPGAAPASPHPAAASSSSASVIDDLLTQAEVQEELLKKVADMCHEIDALCDAYEESLTDAITALPIWRDPRELMAALCTPDEHTGPGNNQDGRSGGFQRPDSQQGRAIEAGGNDRCKETAGSSSAAHERIKNCSEDLERGSYQCERCSQFGHTENTCPDNRAQRIDPPPVLAENRKRKEVDSPTYSYSVAGQALNSSKRTKAPGRIPTSPGSRGPTTRRAAASTPTRAPDTLCSPGPTIRGRAAASAPTRASDTFCSPGPTTRRRAAAQIVSPRVSS